jgi:hypothetical protein
MKFYHMFGIFVLSLHYSRVWSFFVYMRFVLCYIANNFMVKLWGKIYTAHVKTRKLLQICKQLSCNKVVIIKPISGCVRTACSQLL